MEFHQACVSFKMINESFLAFMKPEKASCQLWESEKARVDKRIFVKVTTAIRKDMERISRLFQKLEKTKIQSGFQITFY